MPPLSPTRPMNGPREARAIRFIFDKARTNATALLASSQVGGRQHKGADTRIHDRLNFEFTPTDVAVLGQHDPFAFAGNRKPFGVWSSRLEMLIMSLDVCAGFSKGFDDEVPSEAFVYEVGRRGFRPRYRARTGSLLRCPPAGDHSRRPDRPVIRRP